MLSKVGLIVWWFAIVSATGEGVILEYRDKVACELIQQRYASVGVKTTECKEKGGESRGSSKSSGDVRSGV